MGTSIAILAETRLREVGTEGAKTQNIDTEVEAVMTTIENIGVNGQAGRASFTTPVDEATKKQIETLGQTVATFREFIEQENKKKEEKARRKQEREENARREEEQMRREEKERRREEEDRKAREARAARKREKNLHRRIAELKTAIKGKQPVASPMGSNASYSSGWGGSEIEEIRAKTERLKLSEKRKRSPDRRIDNSPSMTTPAKRTPRKTAVKPVKLAAKLQVTTTKGAKGHGKQDDGRKQTTPIKYTPKRGTPKVKIPTKIGTAGRTKYVADNVRELAECNADDLKRLCKQEEVEYGNKVIAAINIAEKRAVDAYGAPEGSEELVHLEQVYIKKWSLILNTSGRLRKSGKKNNVRKGKNERANGSTQVECYDGASVQIVRIRTKQSDSWHAGILSELNNQERKGTQSFSLQSTGGNCRADSWKKVKSAFDRSAIVVDGVSTTLAKCKSAIEKGEELEVKYLRKWGPRIGPDKILLTKLLRNPRRMEAIRDLEEEERFRLYKSAKDFQRKSTRSYLRRIISRVIKEKCGWEMGADLIVRVKFDDRVSLAEVRKVVNDKIESLDFLTCMAQRARSKIRTVWVKNPTVADLIHNQRNYVRAVVSTCTCAGLPYPRTREHVRFRLHELDGVHPMLLNAGNIPRAQHPDRLKLLCREIEDSFNTSKKRNTDEVVVSQKEVRRCIVGNNEIVNSKCLDIADVKELRGRLEVLVQTSMDKNPGETLVMCPYLYYEAMMEAFVTNPGYEVTTSKEVNVR
ncbi:hypothetical protein CBR_g30291 [Chara braunii]|uniref:Uncharacterized protein n=1 Tax=Chara braunii TaxID=69332 RepID=A0A388JX42_CHABU|nr:hypothetical protein CBR_g30291 [Chara braunii]|eukprot:GBG62337.1 hypothetical protein CBR_g30291 [Chara braunii]